MKIQNPLKFYVDKIAEGDKFSLIRYGDGELLCMRGKKGGNSNGCAYTPELQQALLESVCNTKSRLVYGLQRVLSHDEDWTLQTYSHIDWHDTEIFSEAAARNELGYFIETLNKRPVTIIGNYSIRDATLKLFPHRWFLEIPPTNAFKERERVIENILWEDRFTKEPKVYLFSCGMAANAFIHELHGKVNGWLLDVGHIWDPFAGSKSRCDLQ